MNPHRKIRSSAAPFQGASRQVQGGLTVAVLVLLPLLAVAGSDGVRATLDFTTGVLSLVSLTAAVGWGLLATDRLFLSSRQRLIGQAVHRTAAAASLGFLLLHVTVKVSLGHVALLGAVIPFGLGVGGTAGLIGFGALAGLLMVVAAATGALRSAFATPSKVAGRWRALHALSYPAWCAALVHGLYAGRPPAVWVVVMYSLCLVAVAAVLCLRMLPPPVKRRIAGLITALIKPDVLPADPDPVAREAPLPGADTTALPTAYGADAGSSGRSGLDSELRGTPLPSSFEHPRTEHPRTTLPAPAPPLYEAPPRSSDRLTGPPPSGPGGLKGPGPGIAAGYRAVSPAAGTATRREPSGRWPAPSPAPPVQALRPPPGPAAAAAPPPTAYEPPAPYAPAQEPPYASGAATAPLPAVGDTAPLPGPFYPPPAGEPWTAPAGDRP
ncbi:hypothetical protein [Streptomyces poriferorum]|uniref:Ferric oxidoreductase domain-containing protein n=1 Tax=Streptomyces poriferorum TaxID=2798799 RepID=A0ABY9IUR5_9ACTN|nr:MULTISPECIES: hypothetical protein [unclassified Streptomyces]MDP5311876.1 hypothetical protein [Streptomyces sp. Alt4]WLQ59057.1 hypothetical protein P8A19_28130 [Streptomyces sp. Alt2]